MRTDVYMTTQGSGDVAAAVRASPAGLGIESTWPTNDGDPARFVDYPFTVDGATFKDHLDVVAEHEPAVAVAPDVEKGRPLDLVIEQADRLAEHAEAVVVVPKDVHPTEVPDRFRVGVPIASFGSGAPWSVWEYRDAGPVHLLGGPPGRQLSMQAYLDVASVDTATLGQRCRFGTWTAAEGAVDAPDGWDYKERLEHALTEYAEAWTA